MEDTIEEKPNNRVNAGRGVVKNSNSHSNSDSTKNTTQNQEDEKDRADDRARKAGN